MRIAGIEIHTESIERFLAGMESPSESGLEAFLDFLCGCFQGLLFNVAPATYVRPALGTSDGAVICEIRFSDECLVAALAAAKFYGNWDRLHRNMPLKVSVGQELYAQAASSSPTDQM
jgi:hypothetical protein